MVPERHGDAERIDRPGRVGTGHGHAGSHLAGCRSDRAASPDGAARHGSRTRGSTRSGRRSRWNAVRLSMLSRTRTCPLEPRSSRSRSTRRSRCGPPPNQYPAWGERPLGLRCPGPRRPARTSTGPTRAIPWAAPAARDDAARHRGDGPRRALLRVGGATRPRHARLAADAAKPARRRLRAVARGSKTSGREPATVARHRRTVDAAAPAVPVAPRATW